MLKVLFCGDSDFEFYAKAFYEAAKECDDLEPLIFDNECLSETNRNKNLISKIEYHYKFGFEIFLLNRRLLKRCMDYKPDIVFLYNCTMVYPNTVKKLRKMGVYVALYSNDDPFSNYYSFYTWRHLKKSIKYCSHAYSYRERNISDYKKYGAKNVSILRSYYLKSRNYYIPDDQIKLDVPEVVFLGHMESDERREYIKALLDEGIAVGLNSAWDDFEIGNELVVRFKTDSSKYNELLNKAKIAIVFLSKLNHDTYTRRCFEIPAVKTLMVAPYTDDLAEMYTDGKEIVFYHTKKEFVEKIKYYLEHDKERESVSQAGYDRLKKAGNEATDRVRQIVRDYIEYSAKR